MSNTSYRDVIGNRYNLAAHHLNILSIPNKNVLFVKNFLSRELKKTDNGIEVGSDKYLLNSPYYVMRAKVLQSYNFLPELLTDSFVPINPKSFINYNLSKGDILISKDSNIGETIILDEDYPNYMLSGALYKLPIVDKKYYLLAFLKSDIFRNQLDLKVPKGATIRHAGTKFLDCKIPLPSQKNQDEVIDYIEILVKSILNKEKEIRNKHLRILKIIEQELESNQLNANTFKYELPKLNEIKQNGRINGAYYSVDFRTKEYKIKNYSKGFKNLRQLGFDVSRGQNLQISCIGKSIYSRIHYKNYYKLLLPKNLSIYGTVLEEEYLGNPKKLKTLKEGDIIFGAEGFEKGRSTVIFQDQDNTITNIHGITLNHKDKNIALSIFVKCFLDYLRKHGLIDYYAVGGNGGSLAMKYWDVIPFPTFPENIIREIEKLYYARENYNQKFTLKNYIEEDSQWNNLAGIYDLEKSLKKLKRLLNKEVERISSNEEINPNLDFTDN